MEYQLIRSPRRTLCIQVNRDAQVIVRAPMRLSQRKIDAFLAQKQGWIESQLKRQTQRLEAHPEPDEAEWLRLGQAAHDYIPPRLAHYAAIMGVTPTALHFSKAKTRFGSCSAKDSITFSLRLMTYPAAAIDYVIVHELAHIRHKNHGQAFYRFVAAVLPDYKQREALLRK